MPVPPLLSRPAPNFHLFFSFPDSPPPPPLSLSGEVIKIFPPPPSLKREGILMVRPDLSPWEYRNTCFLVALCCMIIRTGDQEASPSANKKLGVLLVPCWSWKSVPTSLHPYMSFVMTDEFSVSVKKLLQGLVSYKPLFISGMTVLSKGCKPVKLE